MAKRTKPILILVHGLRGNHHGLRFIETGLKDDFEVINLDLPGSGVAPELKVQDLKHHVAWMHEYVSGLKTKPIIVAHSMGAIITSHYVTQYPDDVAEKIVFLAPIFRGKAGKAVGTAGYGALKLVLAPLSPRLKHKVMASRPVSWVISHYLTSDKKQQKKIDEEHYRYAWRFASARSLMGDVKTATFEETVLPGEKDVLVIFGENDRLTSNKLARQRAKSAGVKYVEITQTGHLLNFEKPKAVVKRIREFLGA